MNAKPSTRAKLPTRAEMLAAPEADYMSARQLEFFRNLLIEERDALLDSAKETTVHLQDGGATPDPSDRATIEEDHTLELRVRDRERKHLHKIDQALARIEEGTYGWCEETGDPIGIPRLLARPTASYCIEAQERHEVKEKSKS
ncbi:MAG TPA: RNA polymerase-binding protein DksA [Rhodocyclaceae bacterium]